MLAYIAYMDPMGYDLYNYQYHPVSSSIINYIYKYHSYIDVYSINRDSDHQPSGS